MVITDEILAAYVDGTLPSEQLHEVRQYLSTHPKEMEQVVKMMDTYPRETKEKGASVTNALLGGVACGALATSGAAFVANFLRVPASPKPRQTNIQANLTNLLNEIF